MDKGVVRPALRDYLGVALGSILVALALAWFLVPHRIAAGGVSGLATVVYYVFHLPVGLTMIALNIPLFTLAIYRLGMRFGVRSFWGTIVVSLGTDFLMPRVSAPTQEPLLAAIYGGLLSGVGLGIVFRSGGTTGGTDLAAQLLRRHWRASVGQLLLVVDGMVIVLAGIVFSVELALYGLISLFISSRMIDTVQEGVGYAKVAFIISAHPLEIASAILYHLHRGATALEGEGLYRAEKRRVILCVVNRAEISRLKSLVHQIDPQAFMIVTNVHEALGEGFKDWQGEIT